MKYLSVVIVAVVAVSCSASPTTPSAVQSSAPVASSSERVVTMNQDHRAPLGSPLAQCANDKPVMTQANGTGGLVLFEFRIGHGTSKAELWVYRYRNEPGKPKVPELYGKYEVGDGNPATFKASTQEPITEAGSYFVLVRRLKCGQNINAVGEFSEPKTFSIDPPIEGASNGPSGQCAEIPTAAPCVREG